MSVRLLFGQNVKKVREQKGWWQDRLSEETGLHRTYISGIERGVRNPTIEIRRFKSEVHHLKSLTEESSSVKVGYCSKQTDKLMNYSH
nr:helix-turn-helix transcriptional regulator [Microcystis aeruginosa W13-16]NCQ75057.1 helix-turn-helix transcriptional regulator [Microcystis aeruginosa W13-13]NCQ79512.1 helix-turn-helix transcriptional regulator [Microcystis aeruginosa W13-15]